MDRRAPGRNEDERIEKSPDETSAEDAVGRLNTERDAPDYVHCTTQRVRVLVEGRGGTGGEVENAV